MVSEHLQLQRDRQAAIQRLFADVCAPYLAVINGETEPAGTFALDDFATKLVAHTLETRKMRALQAEAAAKKFVVAAGSSAGASAVEENGDYDPTRALTTPSFAEKALAMVMDALSQVLVCIGALVENAARFLLTNEAFSTELTMLGVNPQTAEAMVEAISTAVSAVDVPEEVEPLAADGVGIGMQTLYCLLSQSSVACNQVAHLRVEPVGRTSLQFAVADAVAQVAADSNETVASKARKALAAKATIEKHLSGEQEEDEGQRRYFHRVQMVCGERPYSIDITHAHATSLLAELMLARELMVPQQN